MALPFIASLPAFPDRQRKYKRRGIMMQELAYATETLKREHADQLKRIERDQLARQLETSNKRPNTLHYKLGDLLILAGQRLHAYSDRSIPPLKQADSGVTR